MRHQWTMRRRGAGSICEKCWASAVAERGGYSYRARHEKTARHLRRLPACDGYAPYKPGAWYGPYRQVRAERGGAVLSVSLSGSLWSARVDGSLIGCFESFTYAKRKAEAHARKMRGARGEKP